MGTKISYDATEILREEVMALQDIKILYVPSALMSGEQIRAAIFNNPQALHLVDDEDNEN